MLSQKTVDARMLELSNTVSDLLVGLKCLDAPEVEREARMLKDQANEYGAYLLEETAHKIEQAMVDGDLDAAKLLLPELHEHLLQARESMDKISAQPLATQT